MNTDNHTMGVDSMNMFDKQSLIQRLKELSLPEKEYWVVAGGAMVLHGFRSQTQDIDLGCSTLLADKLEQQGYFVSRCDDGTRRILYSEDIEIFETSYEKQWYECYYVYIVNTKELWRDVFIKKYTYDYNQLADLF